MCDLGIVILQLLCGCFDKIYLDTVVPSPGVQRINIVEYARQCKGSEAGVSTFTSYVAPPTSPNGVETVSASGTLSPWPSVLAARLLALGLRCVESDHRTPMSTSEAISELQSLHEMAAVAMDAEKRARAEVSELARSKSEEAVAEAVAKALAQTTCVLCTKGPKGVLLQPCHHVCICSDCIPQLGNPQVCPVCNTPVCGTISIRL